jgi:hypothetical protein
MLYQLSHFRIAWLLTVTGFVHLAGVIILLQILDVKGFRRQFSNFPALLLLLAIINPRPALQRLTAICDLTKYGIIEVTLRSCQA